VFIFIITHPIAVWHANFLSVTLKDYFITFVLKEIHSMSKNFMIKCMAKI